MLCDLLAQVGIPSTWNPGPGGEVVVRVVHSACNAPEGVPVFRLWRRNRWAQARSWLAAEITGRYEGRVDLDADEIAERDVLGRLVDIVDRAAELDALPGIVGRAAYEEVVADPLAVVEAICRALGRQAPGRPLRPRTEPSGVNDLWP